MTNLAIIPARGGSKRIPRKNIKSFAGKPIIAYAIETATKSGLFDEVMVSTDDEEIAEIAKQFGAKVPFMRNKKNAGDFSTTIDVLKEVETQYGEKFERVFDYICCIYPTAPMIAGVKLQEGLNLLIDKGFDSVFPVVAFSYPVWRGLKIVNEKIQLIWPEYVNSRSQDLPKVYHDAGQWYWYNPQKVQSTLFTENTSSIILDEMEVQDIDTLSDWQLAELKYKLIDEARNIL